MLVRLIDADKLLCEIEEELSCECKAYTAEQNKWIDTGLRIAATDIRHQPTVKAVKEDDMRAFAEDVVYQFGYYGQHKGRLHIIHAGLSALEWAFDILGWENPHPAPEYECEIDGCTERAIYGRLTKDGYKRVCVKHFKELQEEAADGS